MLQRSNPATFPTTFRAPISDRRSANRSLIRSSQTAVNKKRLASVYFFVDWVASILAWVLFYFFRKTHEDLYINYWDRITNSFTTPSFWLGVAIIPICWLILHAVTGAYEKVYMKSRLKELGQTFFITLLGVVILFFVVILDDDVISYKSYYQSFIALFTLQFLMTYA